MQRVMNEEIIYIQNMDSPRDVLLVKDALESLGVKVKEIEMGTAAYINTSNVNLKEVKEALENIGYRVLQKNEKEFADNVKLFLGIYLDKLGACIPMPILSQFLENQMGLAYSTISKRFRKIENKTIEKYFIGLKIGKVKTLVHSTDLSIKDISLRLNYSNPRSLARKFREVTGFSLYDLKNNNLAFYRLVSGF